MSSFLDPGYPASPGVAQRGLGFATMQGGSSMLRLDKYSTWEFDLGTSSLFTRQKLAVLLLLLP